MSGETKRPVRPPTAFELTLNERHIRYRFHRTQGIRRRSGESLLDT
jgi:hypothetical protein